MKQYQVTRKLQVTIPKKLADKAGIRPGDSVLIDETSGMITLRKAEAQRQDPDDVRKAVEEFTHDLRSIRTHLKKSESALIENLSRHVTSK
jgi:AbrB family looped-hinge helix DNA binding protein